MRKTHCLPCTSNGFVEEGIPSLVCKPDPAQGSLASSWPVRNRAAQRGAQQGERGQPLLCVQPLPFRTPPPELLTLSEQQQIRRRSEQEPSCGLHRRGISAGHALQVSSVQSLSRVQLFATPWTTAPTPPCPLPTHAHRVGDAIQPSHPVSSPSPPAPNPSQHHGLFQ